MTKEEERAPTPDPTPPPKETKPVPRESEGTSENPLERIKALEAKVAELQAGHEVQDRQLVASEHRLPHVVWNLIKYWRTNDNLRRTAAIKAAIWRVFLPSTVIVAGGLVATAIAVWTLLEMQKQTTEIAAQTKAVVEQNKHFAKQVEIEAEQDYRIRMAQLLSVIYDTKTEGFWPWEEKKEVPTTSARARNEAVVALVTLEKARGNRFVDLSKANLTRLKVGNVDFRCVNFLGADMPNSRFIETNLLEAQITGADLTGAFFGV